MNLMRLLLVSAASVALVSGLAAAPVDGDIDFRRALEGSAAISLSDRGSIAAKSRLAQGGSTGGTLGKTNQSLSGGQPKEKHPEKAPGPKRPKQDAADGRQSGCGRIVGVWTWSNGLEVVVRPDATAAVSNGEPGTLTCAGGVYVFKWQTFGNEARMTLSADGKRMSGIGLLGSESAVRK